MTNNKVDSELNSNNDSPNVRKRKRAQRNKERLIVHQSKLLDKFAIGILQDFSDEKWVTLAKVFSQISDYISPDERRSLGMFWREGYVGKVDTISVTNTIDSIKTRLLSSVLY